MLASASSTRFMFDTPFNMMQHQSRKRGREDDDDVQFFPASEKKARIFEEPIQPFGSSVQDLPLRTSQSPPFPGSLGFRADPGLGASDGSSEGSRDQVDSPMTDDVEIEDDRINITFSQTPPTPVHTPSRPAKLSPSPYRGGASIEGRVPTPIHSAFNVPGIPRSSGEVASTSSPNLSPFQTIRSSMAPPPRRFAARDHPMPSPIRESLLSPRDAVMSPAQSGSMETSMAAATQMSRLSMSGGESMDVDDGQPPVMSPAPGTPFALGSPNKGRKRSGALSTEKRRYAVGYRDDCEKCKAKVPGHYSHYLPVNDS